MSEIKWNNANTQVLVETIVKLDEDGMVVGERLERALGELFAQSEESFYQHWSEYMPEPTLENKRKVADAMAMTVTEEECRRFMSNNLVETYEKNLEAFYRDYETFGD